MMTPKEHKHRHIELHKALDELLADFIAEKRGTILDRPIRDLLDWSYKRTQAPEESEHD
jgi:hypothetical protein